MRHGINGSGLTMNSTIRTVLASRLGMLVGFGTNLGAYIKGIADQ